MRVNIVLGQSIANSLVNTSGNHINIINNEQQRAFNIQGHQLRRAIQNIRGREPNDVFVRSPTNPPLSVDLYQRYNWDEVQAHCDILDARVLEMNSTPEIVSESQLVNNSSVGGTFSVDLSTSVTNTVSSNWQVEHGISVGQSVNYSVGVFGGETAFEYSHTWGEGGEYSRTFELNSGGGVQVFLEPGQAVTAHMISNRGQARVQVRYLSRLSGSVATNYNPRHEGHHFWQCPVGQVMDNVSTPREVIAVENLQIGMFTSIRIEIRDKNTNRLLRSYRRSPLGLFIPDYIRDIPGRPAPER